jgi:Rps23 Pro-64 3,4-dihydroxylase Tpa1-like proline 4-hydroxylase
MVRRSKILKHLSLDKVTASLVTAGCTGLLWDAHCEGSAPLKGQVRAVQYSDGSSQTQPQQQQRVLRLQPGLHQQLDLDGYLVIDNFLSREQIDRAVDSLQDDQLFSPSPNEQNGDAVRTDKVYFFKQEHTDEALNEIRKALYQFGHDISTSSSFEGFAKDKKEDSSSSSRLSYSKGWLGVPTTMMTSLYQPNEETGGDYYRAHTDACSDGLVEMGLVGFLRSKYLRKRYLTCILYLNPHWEPAHRGCLRLFPENQDEIDIAPLGGRLVIFSSVHMTHAVLPTSSRRLACSMWMTLNEEE